jgi:hypothetical protein
MRNGGEGGIRTREGLAPLHAFQACLFGRSSTSPYVGRPSRRHTTAPWAGYHVMRSPMPGWRIMAERVGFGPTVPETGTTVFEFVLPVPPLPALTRRHFACTRPLSAPGRLQAPAGYGRVATVVTAKGSQMAVKGWRGLACFPAGVGSWLLGAVGLGRYRWGKACEYSFGVVV